MSETATIGVVSESNDIRISKPEALGYMIGLCAFNGIYSNWTIADIARLFIPPILAQQFKLYFSGSQCVAFATWAYLSDELSEQIRTNFIDPPHDSWNSGNNLWIIDMVAPGLGISITRDLQKTVFADRTAPGFALRRDEYGKVRKIARWATWNSCPRDNRIPNEDFIQRPS